MEFKAFPKIENIRKAGMAITQKIHGSNAQVVIAEINRGIDVPPNTYSYIYVEDRLYEVRAGSRTRWILPENDNYGFAAFVETNKEAFVKTLGVGQHFGEWAGPGINSGEGLTEKTFVLFDYWKYPAERPLPPQTKVVPLLYNGALDLGILDSVMEDLKAHGSKLVPGFLRPEGVVISVMGVRYKRVFEAEETQWKKSSKPKAASVSSIDVAHLLQPIRLEKLLSKDEKYLREYPNSLSDICAAYVADLIEEGQIVGDEDQLRATRKALESQLFAFIKDRIQEAK